MERSDERSMSTACMAAMPKTVTTSTSLAVLESRACGCAPVRVSCITCTSTCISVARSATVGSTVGVTPPSTAPPPPEPPPEREPFCWKRPRLTSPFKGAHRMRASSARGMSEPSDSETRTTASMSSSRVSCEAPSWRTHCTSLRRTTCRHSKTSVSGTRQSS